jgi:uncharacterized protein YqgC (DUF456 family)
MTVLLWMLAVALVGAGIAGLVMPGLPGAPLVFAGLLVAAWIDRFAYVGFWTLAVLAGLAALTVAADVVAGAVGARGFGASGRALAGAAIGGTVGMAFGVLGILLGPFVGAVLGELSTLSGLRQAGKSGIGATLGLALGIVFKMALGFSMVGLFVVDRFVWN